MSKLLTNYCSCVFQVKGKQGQGGSRKASPYAVCAKSVYQRRGERGPGAVACRFTQKVLQSYDLDTLRGWLLFEGVAPKRIVDKLTKDQAAVLIHAYLSKPAKRAVKTVQVSKRQASPKAVHRATRKPRAPSGSPQARRRQLKSRK